MTIVEFLRARLDDRHARASKLLRYAQENDVAVRDPRLLGRTIPGWHEWPEVEQMAREVLAEVDAKRRIITEHEPIHGTVEWDHDQNGRGEALCCPRCQNAEHDEWDPPIGHAYGLPEGFVTPYVLAPCVTLRLLAPPFAAHPDFDEAWRPA